MASLGGGGGGRGLKNCHFAMKNKPYVTLLGRERGQKNVIFAVTFCTAPISLEGTLSSFGPNRTWCWLIFNHAITIEERSRT